jgi:hypothetical protein
LSLYTNTLTIKENMSIRKEEINEIPGVMPLVAAQIMTCRGIATPGDFVSLPPRVGVTQQASPMASALAPVLHQQDTCKQ